MFHPYTHMGDHGSWVFSPLDHDPVICIIKFQDPDQKTYMFFLIWIKKKGFFYYPDQKFAGFFFDLDHKIDVFPLIRIKNLLEFF